MVIRLIDLTCHFLGGEDLDDLLHGELALALDVGRVKDALQLALALRLAPPSRQVHHLGGL